VIGALLKDRVILVTGATSGLGRETALRLAREGACIIGTGRNEGAAASLFDAIEAEGGAFHFRRQDVTVEADWANVMAWIEPLFGRLDGCVNSAGVFFSKPLPATSLDDFRWLWRADVESCFLGTRHALALMRRTGSRGSIVNISSLAGMIGLEDCSAYCPAKAAVNQLSRQFALEAARFDPPCRVNALCPGVIWSDMITRQYGDSDAVKAFVMDGNALQTVGLPSDVAEGVLYLVSDQSRYVTATQLVIDGGRGVD